MRKIFHEVKVFHQFHAVCVPGAHVMTIHRYRNWFLACSVPNTHEHDEVACACMNLVSSFQNMSLLCVKDFMYMYVHYDSMFTYISYLLIMYRNTFSLQESRETNISNCFSQTFCKVNRLHASSSSLQDLSDCSVSKII